VTTPITTSKPVPAHPARTHNAKRVRSDLFIGVPEVAARLGCAPDTVLRRLRRQPGQLPESLQLGRGQQHVWMREDFEKWLRSQPRRPRSLAGARPRLGSSVPPAIDPWAWLSEEVPPSSNKEP
jgi:predicted DNA-binding transcriptional regulator AlpA